MMKRFLFFAIVVIAGNSYSLAASNPRVMLQTNIGYIVVELRPDKSPITVTNFLNYVNSGFYNGLIFHRTIENFMIQGGGFRLVGFTYEQPATDAPIVMENPNGLSNKRGTIAMARMSQPNSATSQFFINHVDNIAGTAVNLDYQSASNPGYCVFGAVTSLMRVVDTIARLPTINAGGPLTDFPVDPIVWIEKAAVPSFVSKTGSDATGDGSYDKPYATIQKAINDADGNGCVMVKTGIYNERIDFGGKNVTVMSTDPADANVVAATVIDGGHAGSVVTFSGTESPMAVMAGFTIRNGNAAKGGGIYGGNTPTQASARYNVISGNTAENGGGIANCDGLIVGNRIVSNSAAQSGGGLCNCGGIVRNNSVANNTAQNCGGGLYLCTGTVKNNTIYGNSAQRGGGMGDCGAATITNSIIWNNTAVAEDDQIYDTSAPIADPCWCCIQNWPQTSGNISSDPQFADAGNGDFHLKSKGKRWKPSVGWVADAVTSRCIDAGSFETTCNTEYRKNVENFRANMGAYGSMPEASISVNGWALAADFTNDGLVNQEDFSYVARQWMQMSSSYDFYCADLNRDYLVNYWDLAVVAEQWLAVTPWSWLTADLDGNLSVNLCDFTYFASNWQKSGSGIAGDFDADGQVGPSDMAFFAGAWLK